MKVAAGWTLLVALGSPLTVGAYDPLRPLASDEITVGASPQYLTGAQLHELCVGEAADTRCLGYLTGVVDGLEVAYDALGAAQGTCLPDWLHQRPGEVRNIVLKHLDSHRDDWETGAGYLTADALQIAFPCPRN